MAATKRPSKAEIKRRIAAAATDTAPPLMSDHHESIVASYIPKSMSDEQWQRAQPLVQDLLRRHPATGDEALRQKLVALTMFVKWAMGVGHPLDREVLMTEEMIEGFVVTMDTQATTAANYRSRLRGIARKANPGRNAPSASVKVAHRSVKAPYTANEVATITRVARVQPNPQTGRQMRACVGLGLGAGLDSVDLRPLLGRHVVDLGTHGIRIDVTGRVERTLWVRRQFEDLVREGLHGVAPGQLVVGTKRDRKNMCARIYSHAIFEGDVPHLEQGRMRTTWILDLLRQGVTLPVLMHAAGLRSARTITDIVALLPASSTDAEALRGGAR